MKLFQRDKIKTGEAVEIFSRPDLGIVIIVKVMKFGKLVCVRTSKGGMFDEFDLIEPDVECVKEFKRKGSDANHSRKDWIKFNEVDMIEFFCQNRNNTMNNDTCHKCFYDEKKSVNTISRALCRYKMQRIEVSVDSAMITETKNDKEVSKEICNSDGIQKLRLRSMSENVVV